MGNVEIEGIFGSELQTRDLGGEMYLENIISLFNKCFLSTFYVPATVLGAG